MGRRKGVGGKEGGGVGRGREAGGLGRWCLVSVSGFPERCPLFRPPPGLGPWPPQPGLGRPFLGPIFLGRKEGESACTHVLICMLTGIHNSVFGGGGRRQSLAPLPRVFSLLFPQTTRIDSYGEE